MSEHATPAPDPIPGDEEDGVAEWVQNLPVESQEEALDFQNLPRGEFVFSEVFEKVNAETRRAETLTAVRDIEMLYRAHLEIEQSFPSQMKYRSLCTQLAVTRSTGSRLWEKRLSNAVLFKTMFLPVYERLQAGEIPLWIAEIIPEEGFMLTDPKVLEIYLETAIELALDTAMTAAKLRKRLRDYVETLREEPVEERVADSRSWYMAGGVKLSDLGDGLAMLEVVLPAVKAYAIKDRLRKIAKAKRADQHELIELHDLDDRPQSLSELEHDTAGDLLIGDRGSGHAQIVGEVRVTVPALSLLTGASRHRQEDLELLVQDLHSLSGNAWLEGYGAVPISDVQPIAAGCDTWYRMFIDPHSGGMIATDAYQAPKALKRFLGFRDPECRFPGCIRASDRCDKDHTIPYRILRETSPDNLANLCRYHHLAKHRAGWKMKQVGDGIIEWISASGQKIRTEPYRVPPQLPVELLAAREKQPAHAGEPPPF